MNGIMYGLRVMIGCVLGSVLQLGTMSPAFGTAGY